jgi:hypothetical protein
MNPIDLEQLVDAELKQLPMPRAPRSLMPRVLEVTVHERPLPTRAGWITWPRVWQVAAAAALIVLAIGAWRLLPLVSPWIAAVLPSGLVPRRAETFARNADEAAAVVRVLWDVLLQPVAAYVSVLAISFALACAALWSAVEHLAPGGASQR